MIEVRGIMHNPITGQGDCRDMSGQSNYNIQGPMTFVAGCQHCGGTHAGQCPRVKAVEYHENGQIKRVEYHTP